MNSKRLYHITLVLVLIAGFGILSGCRYRSPEKRAEWITGKIASKLELSNEQKKELNSFRDELLEKKKELHQSRITIREELINQLGHEKIDQEYLKEVIKKEEARLDETISLFVERLAGFHTSLTPKQREKLIELVKECERHKHKYYRY